MIYEQKFFRNPFTKTQQEKIRKTHFAVVGLGGTGGFILESLLRAGAERITVFDHDLFEYSNFNRQLLATEDTVDRKKTNAAAARAKSINSSARVRAFSEFTSASNLGDAEILLDGTDNVKAKIEMAKAARRKRIPYVFCAASHSRGIVSVFRNYRFEKAFQIDESLDYGRCSTILCPAAAVAGSLAASQAMNLALRKPYVKAPGAVFFDLFKKEIFWRAELG